MSRRDGESGIAMVMTFVVITLIAVVVGVLMQAADAERKQSTRSVMRAEQIAVADSAMSRYLLALNTGWAGRRTNYQLTEAAFTSPTSPLNTYLRNDELRVFAYAPGATTFGAPSRTAQSATTGTGDCTSRANVVPTPAVVRREGAIGRGWEVDDATVGNTRLIVEENHGDRPCAYWEVMRVDPNPLADLSLNLASHRQIGVTFRVWTADDVTPRYVQATISRGVFSDYQLLTDEEVEFGTGVVVTGKVHSNNYTDAGAAITGPSGLRCSGIDAKMTSRRGAINVATAAARPACRISAGSGKAIDLGAMESALREVDAACLQDTTRRRYRCYGQNGGAGYRVEVGHPLRVTNLATGGRETIAHGARPYTLRFDERAVYVRNGATDPIGSVTIFAHTRDVAHIYVEGSSFGPPTTRKPVVGLLAQGDIVVDRARVSNCGNVTINAAMMAETGTLTVPHRWRSQIKQRATPTCGTLTVNGALATRTMPVLQLVWGNDVRGFRNRRLNWNAGLRRVVPPMYPATGPWETGTWREANHDCLGVTMPGEVAGCSL